jgi:hypothetical protein
MERRSGCYVRLREKEQRNLGVQLDRTTTDEETPIRLM